MWSWLSALFNQAEQGDENQNENRLVSWMAKQEIEIDKAGGINNVAFETLPGRNSESTGYSIFITSSDARQLRTSLGERVLGNALSIANEMPIPKFQQQQGDVYQIVPFVRARDDQGHERIHWCDASVRSELFRVASPFDPNATRPTMIQMPSLKDLRAGMAKGIGLVTPPDTFSLLNALKLKKGASEEVLPDDDPKGLGIQWICSFSIPIVTIVAMILLMIMVSLLNIIFFWLPWIRICLPFPKAK